MNKKRWEPIEDEPFYEHGFLEYWREESGGWRICVDNRGFSLPDDIRLCRRVEIDRPRPDWSQAPEWAQWWAVDANGIQTWFQDEPRRATYAWGVSDGILKILEWGSIPIGVDWRTLIEQRPEATHENPA